jgi:hypothetical protein
VLTSDGSLQNKRKRIGAAVRLHLMLRGEFFAHAQIETFNEVMLFDRERGLLQRIRSDKFEAWISGLTGLNKADPTFDWMVQHLETYALNKGTRVVPEAYWASCGRVYYMSNGPGKIVKITADDLTEVPNGTDGVLFPVSATLAPWKLDLEVGHEHDPFERAALWRNMRVLDPRSRELFRLWVFSLPSSPANKPQFCLTGPNRSGKTRAASGIAALYGLPVQVVNIEEKGEDGFWPIVNSGGVVVLDNVDTHQKWLPDTLQTAATGAGAIRRKLYTNAETVQYSPRAWICLTAKDPYFAGDAGVSDRLLVSRLETWEDETEDSQLIDELGEIRDSSLSYIAEVLATALADTTPFPVINTRHPDWGELAVRIGRATGRGKQAVEALQMAEKDKSLFCVENSSTARHLLAYVQEHGELKGKAAECIEKIASQSAQLMYAWKKSPHGFGQDVKNLWVHLSKVFDAAVSEDRNGVKEYSFKLRPSAAAA